MQGQEEKKAKGQNKGRINMDGRPKILTQDEIFNAVVKAHAERDAKKDATVKRKEAKTKYAEAIGVWKVREMDRKEQNSALKLEWEKEVRKWEVERNSANVREGSPDGPNQKYQPWRSQFLNQKLLILWRKGRALRRMRKWREKTHPMVAIVTKHLVSIRQA